ncbi:MAG: hypothetical protein H6P99_734 [Holophagaceae bacterium]|nr:hypothetical protein [Holophagaceae bacterium]
MQAGSDLSERLGIRALTLDSGRKGKATLLEFVMHNVECIALLYKFLVYIITPEPK